MRHVSQTTAAKGEILPRKAAGSPAWACLVLVCVLIASCAGGPGNGGSAEKGATRPPAELTSSADRAEAGVSDPIFFRITLDAAPGVAVSLPEVGPMIQGFRILDMGTEGPKQTEGRMQSQEWFKLQADRPGSYLLPAVRASFTEPDGKQGTVEAPQIFVEVKSLLTPESTEKDIRDLKPLEKIQRRLPVAWILGGAGALLAAGGIAAWLLIRRRKRGQAVLLLPPDERARRELSDLEATGILEEERYREYVFQLSLIFRRFLEWKYRIAAVEQTSEEIMALLRKGQVLEDELKKMTRSFLEETDPIKYCGLAPQGEETETLRTRFLAFLDRSVNREESGTGAQNA